VLYFWPDARPELREIRRVLRPGAAPLVDLQARRREDALP
jgi:hypothetical protein